MLSFPFECRAGGLLFVIGAVIHFYREEVVLAAELDELGDVEADGGDAIFIFADRLPVEKEMPGLPHPVEFGEDLLAVGAGGQLEMFAIPADAKHLLALVAAAVADERAIGVR